MSYTEISLDAEMKKLDGLQTDIKTKTDELRTFITSDDFLTKEKEFENKFGAFQSCIIIATQIAQQFLTPPLQPQTPTAPVTVTETKKDRTMGYGTIIIVVVALGLCYAALDREIITENVFVMFMGAAIVLILLPGLINAIRNIFSDDGEEEQPLTLRQRLKKVNDTLEEMNSRYEAFFFLVMIQNQGEIERYKTLGIDKRIYVRKEQARTFLMFEFSAKINAIIRECNDSIWSRKTTIAMAMVEVARPQPTYGRRGGGEP